MSFRDRVSRRLKSWNTKPRLSRRKAQSSFCLISAMFLPARTTCPPVGLSRDAMMFKSVVLPEPDSPIIATYSPCSTVKFTLSRACTLLPPRRVVYIFLRFLTSSNAIFVPPRFRRCPLLPVQCSADTAMYRTGPRKYAFPAFRLGFFRGCKIVPVSTYICCFVILHNRIKWLIPLLKLHCRSTHSLYISSVKCYRV